MQTLKCKKCGSSKMILKQVQEENNTGGIFDTILFFFLGLVTFGLYFIFYAFAEKKKTELGTAYYECENCHFKMNAKKVSREEVTPKKEEVDEKELEEIREIGKKPVDMSTWKEERQKAVQKKRENQEKAKKSRKKDEKTSKN